MDALAELLKALATLLWPAIVIGMVWMFRPAIASLIESAKSREFSIEIGGQKLSVKEASEQQRTLIADLQAELVVLKRRLDAGASSTRPLPPPLEPHAIVLPERPSPSAPSLEGIPSATRAGAPRALPATPTRPAPAQEQAERIASVLWVDDNPKNNSFFIEQLENAGVRVDLALSTQDGLRKFHKHRYSVVLSDMGRYEDGGNNPHAGLNLVKAVRAADPAVPLFIFCSARAAEQYGPEALRLGATSVNSSSTELYAALKLNTLRDRS